jgi:hypothetical protein
MNLTRINKFAGIHRQMGRHRWRERERERCGQTQAAK